MVLLDQFQTTIVIVIVQNEEELAKQASVVLTNNHEDLGELLIGKMGRKHGDGFNEVIRPWS